MGADAGERDPAHHPGTASGLIISQLMGGVSGEGTGIQGHELARQLATVCPNSRVHYERAAARGLVGDQGVDAPRPLDPAYGCRRPERASLVGIGNLEDSGPLVRYGHLSALIAAGLPGRCVGDVCGRFFTVEGDPVRVLDDRLLAVEREALKSSVPSSPRRAGPTRSTRSWALRSGVITALVTDEWTAEETLQVGS